MVVTAKRPLARYASLANFSELTRTLGADPRLGADTEMSRQPRLRRNGHVVL